MRKEALFKFIPFSKKQKQVLTWWIKDIDTKTGKPISPHSNKNGIICDGSVRSGKTVIMSLSFIIWAMSEFSFECFGMAGKTIGSFRRNVLFLLKIILRLRGYKVQDKRTDSMLIVTKGNVENYFYIFGGKDERSQDLVQGFTSAGFFFDEVALMPESFVTQAIARCSVEGRKLWFNCNPDGPKHWFKEDFIDKCLEKHFLHLHFLLEDNPSLSKKTIEFYKSMFSGVFYQRFILGLWVLAEGIIYDMFGESNLYDDGSSEGPDYNLYYRRYYSTDYGTTNPCVFLEFIEQGGIHYLEGEYYYDSKKKGRQKEDSEYAEDMKKFIGDKRYTIDIVDPSATSFKVALRNRGIRVRDADNDVDNGIRIVASLLRLRKLKINRQKCPNIQKEFGSYIWDEKAAERGVEQPLKENDHAMDALRYYCKTIVKNIGGVL